MVLGGFRFTSIVVLFSFTFAGALAQAALSAPPRVSGGKWMPQQLKDQADYLKELGLEIPASELSNLDTSNILGSIVSLGFCSGFFASRSGLIFTNHHCVQKMLSYLSQQDRAKGIESDFVENGFQAHSRQEERSVGPEQKIYVTQKIENVTDTVLKDIDSIQDPEARRLEIERRMAEIVKTAEKDRPNVRVEVKEFYRSAKYFLVEQLELRDIRMVYAPPGSVGFYGGDTKNWEWKRYVGDWGILRAYVGEDGSSKPYDGRNIPYRSAHSLKIAGNGLEAHDPVITIGYPGTTSRLLYAQEVQRDMDSTLPNSVGTLTAVIDTLDQLKTQGEDLRIKVESQRFSLSNYQKKYGEELKALERVDFKSIKRAQQEELEKWIQADPRRVEQYGSAIQDLEAVYAKYKNTLDDTMTGKLLGYSSMLSSAFKIARMAEERQKPDAQREPEYKERNWPRLEQAEIAKQGSLDARIDTAVFDSLLTFAATNTKQEARPTYLQELLDAREKDPRLTAKLFTASSVLLDPNKRLELLKTATPESLRQNADPVIQLALKMLPIVKEQEKLSRAYAGERLKPMRAYIQALEDFAASQGKQVAPDANSTMRVTYGFVKGYKSRIHDGVYMPPFTYSRGILDEHRENSQEFSMPPALYKALHAALFHPESRLLPGEGFGPGADPRSGDLPINFTSNVDTTGGNSGSVTINKKGEAVGLLFDGNQEFLTGDKLYDDAGNSIHVDIRYPLWYMAKVDRAQYVLEELDITGAGPLGDSCRDYLLAGAGGGKK